MSITNFLEIYKLMENYIKETKFCKKKNEPVANYRIEKDNKKAK